MIGIVWMAFHTDRDARMSKPMAILLVSSVVLILACVLFGLYLQIGPVPAPKRI